MEYLTIDNSFSIGRSCISVLQTWQPLCGHSPQGPCSDLLLKGLQLIAGTNHSTSHNPPATALWGQRALVEYLSQGSHKQRRCFSKANASPAGDPACSNTPASFHLSVPAGPATMAKDGDEAPSPSGCRGAAGPGPAGSHPPAPTAGLLPAPAASLVPPRAPKGGGCPPLWRTSPQKKAPHAPHSPAAGAGPWPEQEVAGGGEGRSPMVLC